MRFTVLLLAMLAALGCGNGKAPTSPVDARKDLAAQRCKRGPVAPQHDHAGPRGTTALDALRPPCGARCCGYQYGRRGHAKSAEGMSEEQAPAQGHRAAKNK